MILVDSADPGKMEKCIKLLKRHFTSEIKKDVRRHEFFLRPAERARVKAVAAQRRKNKFMKRHEYGSNRSII